MCGRTPSHRTTQFATFNGLRIQRGQQAGEAPAAKKATTRPQASAAAAATDAAALEPSQPAAAPVNLHEVADAELLLEELDACGVSLQPLLRATRIAPQDDAGGHQGADAGRPGAAASHWHCSRPAASRQPAACDARARLCRGRPTHLCLAPPLLLPTGQVGLIASLKNDHQHNIVEQVRPLRARCMRLGPAALAPAVGPPVMHAVCVHASHASLACCC